MTNGKLRWNIEVRWMERSTAYMIFLTLLFAMAMCLTLGFIAALPLFVGFWFSFGIRKCGRESLTFQIIVPTLAMFGICILLPFVFELIGNRNYHAVVFGDTLEWRIGNWFRWTWYWVGVLWAMMLSAIGSYLTYALGNGKVRKT